MKAAGRIPQVCVFINMRSRGVHPPYSRKPPKFAPHAVEAFSHRVVLSVDAKAVLGAAAKGRTSAPTFSLQIRRMAAITIAGNFFIKYVYIPSEDNPADAPSRGEIRYVRGSIQKQRPTVNRHKATSSYPTTAYSMVELRSLESSFCEHYGMSVDEALGKSLF